MELKQYLSAIKTWWWLMLISVVAAAGAGYVAVSRTPRVYQATATVMVGQSLQSPNPSNQDLYISQQLAQTYREMVTRQPILRGVQEALGLPFVPWSGNVSAQLVPGTQLLEISVRDTEPRRAAAIADEIARQLIQQTPNQMAEDQARQAFIHAELKTLEANILGTEKQIQEQQQKLALANSARAMQQVQDNVVALEQKLAVYQSTYASLLQNAEARTNYVSIFESATIPSRPISPQVTGTVLLAAVTGLVLSLGGAFLLEFLDDTIKTPDDVRRIADLPTLGSIGRANGKEGAPAAAAAREPLSPFAEAYRALRTNIQASSIDRPIRTLVVTSARPQEGKSTVSTNLAVVMAQAGKAVILVDADLRRSSLHKMFGLPNREGLTNALFEDKTSPNDWHQATGVEKLRVLPSGPLPLNPSEILGSHKMHNFIEKLKAQADIVIFDTPPSLSVTDAAVLAFEADGVLLVVEAGRTRRAALGQAVEQLRQVGAHVLGIVLNGIPAGHGKGYYYYQSQVGERGQPRRWLQRRRPPKGMPAYLVALDEAPGSDVQEVALLDPEQHATAWSGGAQA